MNKDLLDAAQALHDQSVKTQTAISILLTQVELVLPPLPDEPGLPLADVIGPVKAAPAIAQALHLAGVTGRQDQAMLIGEAPSYWSRLIHGNGDVAMRKVNAWLQNLDHSGYTFHLTIDPHVGCIVKVAE